MAIKTKKKKATKSDKRDAEIRRLRKENKLLRDKLAKACDLALDSADVIEDDGIGVDEEEAQDFRDMIMDLRAYAKRPEAERHVERRTAKPESDVCGCCSATCARCYPCKSTTVEGTTNAP